MLFVCGPNEKVVVAGVCGERAPSIDHSTPQISGPPPSASIEVPPHIYTHIHSSFPLSLSLLQPINRSSASTESDTLSNLADSLTSGSEPVKLSRCLAFGLRRLSKKRRKNNRTTDEMRLEGATKEKESERERPRQRARDAFT